MNIRKHRQEVERISFADGPMYLRIVRCYVPEHTQHSFDQVAKPLLLCEFRLGLKPVDGQQWSFHSEGCVNKLRAIALESSPASYLVRNALRRLQDRMKIVLLHPLRAAKPDYVAVDIATHKLCSKSPGALFCFGNRLSRDGRRELSIFSQTKPTKRQKPIEANSEFVIVRSAPDIPNRGHHGLDKRGDVVAAPVLDLLSVKRVKYPRPARAFVRPRYAALSQHHRELGVRHFVGEEASESFELISRESI